MHTCGFVYFSFFPQGKRLISGRPENDKPDHPVSYDNQLARVYADIDDTQKESGSEPHTNGDLNITHQPSESQDQPPSLPLKREVSHQTSLPPAVPQTPRPSGAVDALAMGAFQLTNLKVYPPSEDRRDSKPRLFPRVRELSVLSDPSTSLQEENTPQATYPLPRERVYSNMESSEITDPPNHLPETEMHQKTIPPTILEQEERPYGNELQPSAKISVESHDEWANDITDDNEYLELAPLEV